MNSEKIAQFVLMYCNEHKLKYTKKDRIYTIKLNSAHQKWFETKELNITFDPNMPKSKKIQFIDSTSKILQVLTANYITRVPFTSLTYSKKKHQLLDANERVLDLPKKGITCVFEEKQITAYYFLLELTYQTSQGTKSKLIEVLNTANQVTIVDEIELEEAKKNNKPVTYNNVLRITLEHLPKILQNDLESIEEEHLEKVGELATITQDNSEEKYKELQIKEDTLLFKMEELKEKSIRASSFDTRRNLDDKIRDLKKKHQELVEKNKITREEIRSEFEKEKTQFTKRETKIEVEVQSVCELDMPIIQANFQDGDIYYYVPIIGKFIKMST